MKNSKSMRRIITLLLITINLSVSANNNRLTNADIGFKTYIKAFNTNEEDNFGFSIAMYGDLLVVGAPLEDSDSKGVNVDGTNNKAQDSGAVYVFSKKSGNWKQEAFLKASNTDAGDQFGYSVAIYHNSIVIGAPFEDSNSSNQLDDSKSNAGAVYVFTQSSGRWGQQSYLKSSYPDTDDNFGYSVGISADHLVVGMPNDDSTKIYNELNNDEKNVGAALVFEQKANTWIKQAFLKASNLDTGDNFGNSVAIDNDTIVVGARYESSKSSKDQKDNTAKNAGAAYVFEINNSSWKQKAYLKADNSDAHDEFAHAIAISGDTIVIGAHREDSKSRNINQDSTDNSATDSGAAYVFEKKSGIWQQSAFLKTENSDAGDEFGQSVAVFNNNVIVGAMIESGGIPGITLMPDVNTKKASGAAYQFAKEQGKWQFINYHKAINVQEGDWFGYSVALTKDTIAVSALLEESNAMGINGDTKDNWASASGAVYTYVPYYQVEGKVHGLLDNNPVTLVNKGYIINTAGMFGFEQIADGTNYAIKIKQQPSNPDKTCYVTGGNSGQNNGTGKLQGYYDKSIVVICKDRAIK